jgi:3-oxoadipate enol-lactonase
VLSLAACDCRCNATPEFSKSWDPRIATAERDGMEALVEPTLQRWFTSAFYQRNPPALGKVRGMIRRTSVSGYVGCAAALKRIDCEPRLSNLQSPTLFLTGENDPSAPPDLVRQWAGRVKDSRFLIIRNAAHITNIEQPDSFYAELDAFLSAARA